MEFFRSKAQFSRYAVSFLLLLLIHSGTSAVASTDSNLRPGALDRGFAPVLTRSGGRDLSVVPHPNGKWLVSGTFLTVEGLVVSPGVARLNGNGSIDATFQPKLAQYANLSQGSFRPHTVVQPSGRVITTAPVYPTTLIGLKQDGTIDETFQLPPEFKIVWADDLTVGRHGDLYLLGSDGSSPDSLGTHKLYKFDQNGRPWPDYRPAPPPDAQIQAVAESPDGKLLLLLAQWDMFEGWRIVGIARLNLDGSLDKEFHAELAAEDGMESSRIRCWAVLPNGKILLGGAFKRAGDSEVSPAIRLTETGALDSAFHADERLTRIVTSTNSMLSPSFVATALAVQADGRILITAIDGIQRMEADGRLDVSFKADPALSYSGLRPEDYSMEIQSEDERIYVEGVINNRPIRFFELDNEGHLLNYHDPQFASFGSAHAVAVQANGKTLVGGFFDSVNAIPASNLVRLNVDGSVDMGFRPPQAVRSVQSVAEQSDGKILVGGSTLIRLNSDGSIDPSFKSATTATPGGITALSLQSDGKILVGAGSAGGTLVRLMPSGMQDLTFASQRIRFVSIASILPDTDGRIVVGGTTWDPDALPNTRVIRFLQTGAVDTTFGQALTSGDDIAELSLTPDGGYIAVGGFDKVDNQPRYGVARFGSAGTLDPGFGDPQLELSWTNRVFAVVAESDGKILLGGSFRKVAGQSVSGLARLNSDGTFDNSFPSELNLSGGVAQKLAATRDQAQVVVAGKFVSFDGGLPRVGLARLWLNPPPRLSITRSDQLRLQIEGDSERRFGIEVSPDLKRWLPVGTNNQSPGETKVSTTEAPHLFYRAALVR